MTLARLDLNGIAHGEVFGLRRDAAGAQSLCDDCRYLGLAPDRATVALSFGDHLDLVTSDGGLLVSFPDGAQAFFSPDGSRVAIPTWSGQVFVAKIGEDSPIELAVHVKDGGSGPTVAWSPDGGFLAIPTTDGLTVWEVASATPAVALPTIYRLPMWNPDSLRLAAVGAEHVDFVDREGRPHATFTPSGPSDATQLWLIGHGWSPDGEHFALDQYDGEVIRSLAARTSEANRFEILDARAESVASFPSDGMSHIGEWSPRTTILAFEAVAESGSTLVLWSPEHSTSIPVPERIGELTWSADGSRLLVKHSSGSLQTTLIDVTAERVVNSFPSAVTWNGDGSRLVFVEGTFVFPAPSLTALWTSDADGNDRYEAATAFRFAWLPDNRYLVYSDMEGIFSVRFDGEDRRELFSFETQSVLTPEEAAFTPQSPIKP